MLLTLYHEESGKNWPSSGKNINEKFPGKNPLFQRTAQHVNYFVTYSKNAAKARLQLLLQCFFWLINIQCIPHEAKQQLERLKRIMACLFLTKICTA